VGASSESGSSTRAQLVAFALALVLPILAFIGFVLFQFAVSERARVEQSALDKARNMAVALDRELGGFASALNVLASSPALRSGDLEGFYRQAAEVRDRTGYWVVLSDRATNQQLVNTRVPWGTPLPISAIPSPNAAALSADRRAVVSNLFLGAVAKVPLFAVQVPIERNGQISYLLSLSVPVEAMRDVIVTEEPPDGWIASVVDRNGVILARNERHAEFVGKQATPDLLEATQGREGTWRGFTLDGQAVFGAYARSRLSDWRLALGVRETDLNASVRRSLWWFAGFGIGALLLSALMAQFFGQRITAALSALKRQAFALGRGEVVTSIAGPLREANQVSLALADASIDLRRREAANARLAAIVSSSSDAIVSFAAKDGRILTWNRGAERLFGYTEDEALGRPANLLVPPEQPEGPNGVFDWALSGRRVQQHETVRVAKSGERIDVAVTAARMEGDDGHAIGVSAIFQDIRERKRSEAALRAREADLRRSEMRYRLVVENATDFAILTTDLAGKITGWNIGARNVFGWSSEETIGRSADLIFTPEDRAAGVPEAEMGLALREGRAPDERWHVRKDGSRFFATGAMLPKRDATGTLLGFLKIVRDRTQERETEEAMRDLNAVLERRVAERTQELATANERLVAEMASREQAEEQLRQAQKMEAVGRLTGGVAHDFNNLLTIITGSLDMLRRRVDGADERVKRLLDHAIEGANRAAALTYRLLAFSRQQPLAPEPIDANKLVAGMSDLLRRTLGENIAVETVLAGGLWRSHADPNQLENAILNLAVNARDAMPDGGKLTIETANAHLDEAYAATRPEVTPGQYVLIAVCDTGSGMPPEVIARALEPFFTTKPVGKGTGLGLPQVYGFAKQSGGHMAIYSEVGEGTTVKLYLPRFRQASEATERHRTAEVVPLGPLRARAGETVLVVEDEPMVRDFSVSALEEAGYRVLAAEDGPSGLALLDAHPETTLLFTDVVLTGPMNGRKVADEAVRRRPDLKVLFTTGYTRNAIIHHGRLDEGVSLITKPFTATGLAGKVRRVLDDVPDGGPSG
jgi:PAS domain S-box-containing protein